MGAERPVRLDRDPWDPGLCGVIYENPEHVTELHGQIVSDEKITSLLIQEVEHFDRWLNNTDHAYVVEELTGTHPDGPHAWTTRATNHGYYSTHEALSAGKHALSALLSPTV